MINNHQIFQVNTDGYSVQAQCQQLDKDLLIAVWGGEPHIGAVAMAQPRSSLKDLHKISATASVFCYIGHKDDEVAKMMAEKIASKINTKVVVAAGLHWDNLTNSGIKQVITNIEELTLRIIEELDVCFRNLSENKS